MSKNISENILRVGSFTSSQIFKLLSLGKDKKSLGKPGQTYIEERNLERKLGRSIKPETSTNAMSWGTFCEKRVHDLLGMEYIHIGDETTPHPTIPFWCGSKDFLVPGIKISEAKAYQPKKFAEYTDALYTKDIDFIRENFPDEYWQIVSNAIINGVPVGEAISYMPYLSELPILKQMVEDYDDDDKWKYRFIWEKDPSWLPWLPDEGYYKNLNCFEFEVPKSDIVLLTEKVLEFGELLIPYPKPILQLQEKAIEV